MNPIKVAIVEDRSDLRKSLTLLIKECCDLEFVCACATAEEALQTLPVHKPEVVLMDLHLPRANGIECTRKLKALNPKLEILMLTVEESRDDLVFKALQAGASGYLVKRHSMDRVLESIKAVHRGEVPISPTIARKVLASFRATPSPAELSEPLTEPLTPREEEILSLIAHGFRNKEIATQLGIEIATIDTHLRSAYRKLAAKSRTEAVVKFLGWPLTPAS